MSILIQIIGWTGAIIALGAYITLVTNSKINGNSRVYQAMQLIAASALATNAYYSEAWPLMTLNVIWAGIAIYSLLRKRR